MNRFKETVAKLAQLPISPVVLPYIPKQLVKTANKGVLAKLFGSGKGSAGYQDVLKHITSNVGATALTASGGLLAYKMQEQFVGNPDEAKATHSEVGKLRAQNKFKNEMVGELIPAHRKVYTSLLKDEVISKADKGMIQSAFKTMQRFAPNLAADENAARSFLREPAIHGVGPSYATLKTLAEAEQAVAKAGGALSG
jgi:hypothetical protein